MCALRQRSFTLLTLVFVLILSSNAPQLLAEQPLSPAASLLPEQPLSPAASQQDGPPMAALRKAIVRAVGYIVRACGTDGRFTYIAYDDPTRIPPRSYNILRHAGTMYALGHGRPFYPGNNVGLALERSGKFLLEQTIGPVGDLEGLVAVWSRPKAVYAKYLQAKLGGAGLGLVGLLALERSKPGSVDKKTLEGLGRFITYLQKSDGRFVCKYIPARGGPWDGWTSLYYPGEAALGLIMLFESTGDRRWLVSAGKALAYLERLRRGKVKVEPDHWALLATQRFLLHHDAASDLPARSLLLSHATQVTSWIVHSAPSHSPSSPIFGCMAKNGRTCPTATRCEGLVAAARILPPEQALLRAKVALALHRACAFLIRSQLTSGPARGGIPRSSQAGNDPRAGEIRIDYVQHTLSAWVTYLRWRSNPKPE